MSHDHPYEVSILSDTPSPGRYRWAVLEGENVLDRAPFSYATKREAQFAAVKAMQARIDARLATQGNGPRATFGALKRPRS